MKKDEIVIGGTYTAKVGSRTLDVRIDSENAKGGWNATGIDSGKPVHIKDARYLRAAAVADADGRTIEPADDDGGGAADIPDGSADTVDGDTAPLPKLDKEKGRGGKKSRAAKAPKEKTLKEPARAKRTKKETGPKPMSCLDAAAAVLKAQGEPMRCKEMVAEMKEKELWTTDAPTPEATLYSAILRELAKGKDSRFCKTDRGHFTLNSK